MAVTFNVMVSEELHKDIENIAIKYNDTTKDAITKTQMINLLLLVVFLHHSNSTIVELAHNIMHPPKKDKTAIAKKGKKSAEQNKN